jgi:hypothetical protein
MALVRRAFYSLGAMGKPRHHPELVKAMKANAAARKLRETDRHQRNREVVARTQSDKPDRPAS